MRRAVLALTATLVALSGGVAGEAKKSKLEGTWKVVAAVEGGKEAPKADEYTLLITGDRFTFKQGDAVKFSGTFKRDRTKKPRQIDATVTEGPDKYKGKTSLGIYEFKDDTLRWCAGEPGSDERPSAFASPEGSRILLMTLKRETK
jgi:uncharacterized protein (TIGR03067 family)